MQHLPVNVSSALIALSGAVHDDLEFDANGECTLAFEDDVQVLVAYSAEQDVLTLRAPLVEGPLASETLLVALELNYAQVPPHLAMAVDPQGDGLVLIASWTAKEVSHEIFVDEVCAMVAVVPILRDHLTPRDDPVPSMLPAVVTFTARPRDDSLAG